MKTYNTELSFWAFFGKFYLFYYSFAFFVNKNSILYQLALQQLPDPVFLTLDVDVFDWSVIMSTGTPEPGGLLWDEGLTLLQQIFMKKQVIGFDVVELSYQEHDRNSPFAVAKLIYKMLGFNYQRNTQ